VQNLLKKGISPQQIANELRISLKAVYYLKDSPLKRGRKTKYSLEKIQNVKELYSKGVPAKEIASKMEIPLRTVYSLLKR